jgi:hypothetical protein
MANGALIGESLRVGASLNAVVLTVDKISRIAAGDEETDQPRLWTFIEFEVPDEKAAALAGALSGILEPEHGWYCDFRTHDQTYVVFAERIFAYPRGDRLGRAEAATYARSVGVPESQLDWPE